ncbi:MAG TPA: diacylglycerol kinase family protein [Candidatus Acidoferrales bacterium]|jgi:YegS/Rv2252/BmrU family lipid kinase|nr:diacylglycerol kinase family protein [Candidatus Acidoferrales bacterium]
MPDGIKDAVLIYNPTSGRKRHRRFVEIEKAARLLKDQGIATEIAPTTGPNSATQIARQAVEQRRGMVIACGGDGTINEIINGLAGSQIPMALLPAGTANILAKELGIPWDIPHAARLIPGGTIRRIALGIAFPLNGNASEAMPRTGRYFLSVGGAGPDGAIVNGVHKGLKDSTGVVAYWVEGLRQLFGYTFPEMRVRSGGQERKATILIAGRTVNYGGPFKITTGANLYEDSFEFLINSRKSRLEYLACLPAIWMGKLREMDGIEMWKAAATICEPAGNDPVFAQVDGEPVGKLPIEFKIVPDALSIIAPAPARG